jgi:hypothetical protein
VPDVDTTVLPFRSSSVLRFAAFLETKRLAVTKWVIVKAGGDRVQLDLDLVVLQRPLHGIGKLVAELGGIADDLLLVVVIGEGH